MAAEDEEQGLSTPQKVAAGAALGIAIPAAAVVAKKLLGNDENADEAPAQEGSAQEASAQEGSAQESQEQEATTETRRETRMERGGTSRGTTSKSGGARRGGSSSSTRARGSGSSTAKTSGRSGSPKQSSGSRKSGAKTSSSSSGTQKTREQLYRQATRLKIEGRSKMNKAQLERAVERAQSRT